MTIYTILLWCGYGFMSFGLKKDWDTSCYPDDFKWFEANNISRSNWRCPKNDFCSKYSADNIVACPVAGLGAILLLAALIITPIIICAILYGIYYWLSSLYEEAKMTY